MATNSSSQENDQRSEFLDVDAFRLRNYYKVAPGVSEDSQRYIISADINDIYSALGCMLFVLLPCWKYAVSTGRTLVIDWRGNPYTRNTPDQNLFPLLFQIPHEKDLGVSCIADGRINDLALPQPLYATVSSLQHENGEVDELTIKTYKHNRMKNILRKQEEVENPTVMPCLKSTFALANNYGPIPFFGHERNEDVVYSMDDAKQLYQAIKPLPQWKSIADGFAADHFSERPILGVHIRHGNGEGDFRNHFIKRTIQNMDEFIDIIIRKIKRYGQQHFNNDYTLLLCTDSILVIDAIKPHFSDFVTRPIWRPEPGTGMDFDAVYQEDRGLESAVNALIDMLLLAKCDTVLMTRNSAFLAQVPYVFEKPMATFYNAYQTAALPYS